MVCRAENDEDVYMCRACYRSSCGSNPCVCYTKNYKNVLECQNPTFEFESEERTYLPLEHHVQTGYMPSGILLNH